MKIGLGRGLGALLILATAVLTYLVVCEHAGREVTIIVAALGVAGGLLLGLINGKKD